MSSRVSRFAAVVRGAADEAGRLADNLGRVPGEPAGRPGRELVETGPDLNRLEAGLQRLERAVSNVETFERPATAVGPPRVGEPGFGNQLERIEAKIDGLGSRSAAGSPTVERAGSVLGLLVISLRPMVWIFDTFWQQCAIIA